MILINLEELNSQRAMEFATKAKPVKEEKAVQFLDGLIDVLFQRYRQFFRYHKEFMFLSRGKYFNDESLYYVYITKIEDNFGKVKPWLPWCVEIIEVTDSEREVYGGYRFLKAPDEIIYKFSVIYYDEGIRREAVSLKELEKFRERIVEGFNRAFESIGYLSFYELNNGFKRDGYL